jgi:hypothetical protein
MGYLNNTVDWTGAAPSITIDNSGTDLRRKNKIIKEIARDRNEAIVERQAWANVARILEEKGIYTRKEVIALKEIALNAAKVHLQKKGIQGFVDDPPKESPLTILKKRQG